MKKGLRTFTVIIGDLFRSREVKNRSQLARKITTALSRFAAQFRDEFYAPLILTRGIDELSGVLVEPSKCYLICRSLNETLHPYAFRFAIVKGPLDIAVETRNAGKMDGPAFHDASDLLEKAKKENRFYCFKIGTDDGPDICLNELTNLLHIVRSGWSVHQGQVVDSYEKLGLQEAVAKKLGITQQAVSDALRNAHWKDVKRAENSIEQILRCARWQDK